MGWVLIVVAFIISRPLGILLLVIKLIRMASKALSQPKKAQPQPSAQMARYNASENPSVKAPPVTNATKKLKARSGAATALQILGMLMIVAAAAGLLLLPGDLFHGDFDWRTLFPMLACFCAGAVVLTCGASAQHRRDRIAQYLAILGDRDMVPIEELAAVSGRPRGTVSRDVRHLMKINILDAGAFLDTSHNILFKNAGAYQSYLAGQMKREEMESPASGEYADILRSIRTANDRIPDPVFSDKLDRMEQIAGSIFREVEEHPEKQKQAARFFDYYLPTTLKLLDTYVEFQDTGLDSDSLNRAKARIEASMGNLLESFEKQLGDLYSSEVMDVDAEIQVMEVMISRDLSNATRDFGID